jgi:hypothetical protein
MLRNSVVTVIGLSLCLTGCEDLRRLDEHDPELKYTRKEYEVAHRPGSA